jgi:pantothenate kinase
MDGFHLAGSELARLGRAGRKGSPDTFDADGYVALLRRLRATPTTDVYAPEFRREIEEPVAGAVLVSASTALVVTEGNYLLLDDPPWSPVRDLLDEVWFVDMDEERRVEQLIARHVRFGRSESQARAWALSTDQRNAELVASTRRRADVVVRLDGGSVRIVPGEDEESR